MQSKGVVKFFLVILALVCLYQFVLIFPTNRVENEADSYAANKAGGNTAMEKVYRAEYLDSMSTETVFEIPFIKKFTYQDLKSSQLALGLDLKGGMSVVMQVDLKDFIQALASDAKNEKFQQALDNAEKRLADSQSDFVTLFVEEWQKLADGEKLADIFVLNEKLRNEINAETTDGQVGTILRQKADENVSLTFKLLKERIDKLGVTQPNVSLDEARDLILVELPGIDNPERARQFLSAAAKLEFWDVYRASDPGLADAFLQANDKLKKMEMVDGESTNEPEFEVVKNYGIDSLGNVDSSNFTLDTVPASQNLASDQGPLFDVFQLNQANAFAPAVMGIADKNKREAISQMLARPEIKSLFPNDVKFLWSKDPIELNAEIESQIGDNQYELYAIKMPRGQDVPPLDGEHVTDANPSQDSQNGEVVVSLKMDSEGAKTWGRMTTAAYNGGNREIAIVLDNEVVSAPRVINPILSGDSQIQGNYTVQSAKDLSNILQVGKLPVTTKIIQESIVGPSLGKDNINKSTNALIYGFLLVVIFMVLYYAGGGIVSIIALAANVIFILGALASYGTVLTLPGIAGIVLTIGMAVDANVIIYERIREELRAGKSTLASIKDGFQQSYSAIIDANVTTLLTALVLAYFGLGPIKGFAVVLIIGVLSSLFTAVLVARLVIDWWTGKKDRSMSFWTGWSENILANVNIDWIGKRKIGYIISGILIVISLGSIFTKGFDLGVDFKGGYSYTVQFDKSVGAQEIREGLAQSFGSAPVVKAVDTENTYNITTSYLIDDNEDDAADRVVEALFNGVKGMAGGDVTIENFKNSDSNGTRIVSASKVGPTIADDIQDSSFESGFFALLLIFLYLFIRFSKWEFSLGAVLALFHDVIITLGMFSLLWGIVPFTMEIDQALVAAILTVIGYSVNDTVIVFDRIREFINTYAGKSKEDIFNLAINNTLSRTLITSCTTLFVVLILFIFGGGSIKGFAFALLIGILVGTYSSIFVASATVVDLVKDIKVKAVEKKKEGSFTRAKAQS
ncbi:MAG: protein translocase subunit SecDF [Saprospiraceae bacterium]